ncbi:Autophagy-related protein 2 [Penicillium canariense]|uniref:Autophagy-related protein 2 n=1 Tax=Penicillium canariense TaxID=189055 RepID=A0A9W9LSP8_9EURO|nr:Autophagy-related protein 2 [Penicillium canariense]KAJ5174304.1 Autophagy-related protein 2 [Penicillium canariense]
MAYFLPSFLQKRLLKYALSRLGVVDTEALDLDNLGICWGQRSTVELRDIGLRLEKLATLLNLPATCKLLSARVQLLRITVPADIYSSGIICEASGINVHIQLLSDEACQGKYGATKYPPPSAAGVHGSGDGQVLPTPSNLAESFLEAEPKEEKEELQAAISSQSHILQKSSSFTDEEDDELGLGSETLSLPSFVAGFFKGVADRLQLKIKNVVVRLDMELKQDGPSKRQPEAKPDLVAGLLSVGEIDVHGVSGFTAGSGESLPMREGKRLVSLVDINLGLVSDSVVFSNYARFTAPASPTTTMHSKESQSSSRAFSPPPLAPSDSDPGLAMTRSTIFEPSLGSGFGSAADDGMDTSIFSHETFSHDGRFSDADSEAEHRHDRYPDDSQTIDDDPFHDNPGYLDSVIDTQFDDFDDEPSAATQLQMQPMEESGDSSYHLGLALRSNPRLGGSTDLGHSEIVSSQAESFRAPQAYGSQRGSQFDLESDIAPRSTKQSHGYEDISTSRQSFPHFPSQTSAPPSEPESATSEAATPEADLMESKYFSHDEAQSLYMSAMSHGTGRSFIPNMPGAWDSFIPGEDAGNHSENHKVGTEPIHDIHTSQEEQDEVAGSTPKLTVPSESYFGEQRKESQAQSQSASTDRASTPSPILHRMNETRKPVLNIDKILIWLPSTIDDAESDFASSRMPIERTESDPKDFLSGLRDSTAEESMFASKAYVPTRSSKGSAEYRVSPERSHLDHQQGHTENKSHELEVELCAVTARFDIATGWLLVKTGQRISQMFKGPEKAQTQKQTLPNQPSQQTALKLDVHNLSVKFIEHVVGHSYPQVDSPPPPPPPFTSMEDIILQVTASGLRTYLSANEKRTNLHLDISKLTFGFASEDLISFNESLRMRESSRDIMTPSQGDISFSLTKSVESAKLDISTLPLHVNLHIQRLEEVLGWMGGLSTILELGNSISSTSAMKGAQRPPKKRPRGVHFETPPPAAGKDQKASVPWKVNARMGGFVLDVTGETHYLKLSTTAIKIVSRFEGIGVQIDKARLSGPHPLDELSDAPAKVTLTNIRVEFLFSPKEVDLDRLLTLITPSKDKYDDDDDIMLDTLLRQRRQGSVLRVTVAGMKTVISNTVGLAPLSSLGSELGRLSNVTKYLPEDDRPGILTLTLVREFETQVHLGGEAGDINGHFTNVEVAWISMPSLTATQIGTVTITRNHKEELAGEALVSSKEKIPIAPHPPVLMARYIPDEMDPTFKIKLHHLRVEYTIPSVMAFLGLGQDTTGGELAGKMANSIANLADHSDRATGVSAFSPSRSDASGASSKPTKLAVVFRDCVLGLNPRNSPSKGLVVLTNSKFNGTLHGDESTEATLDIRKASIMIIDNVANVGNTDNLHQRTSAVTQSDQVQEYIEKGYVPVSSISTATVVVKMMRLAEDGAKSLDVELKNRLLILETCADSTQTLIGILNGLQPPTPPSVTAKYRTEVTPIQDMLASFSGDAFNADPSLGEKVDPVINLGGIPEEEEHEDDELEYVSDFYPKQQEGPIGYENIEPTAVGGNQGLLDSFHSHVSSSLTELDFQDDHFAKQSAVGGTAHRWDSSYNTYGLSNDAKLQKSPLRVRVRDVHVIWNLFDGYDWQGTRDTISKAVEDVEVKATERRARTSRMSPAAEDEEESVIGDFLFNSIYIGIPANKDPRELHRDINRDINDLASETGSYATSTTVTGATNRQGRPASGREKRLRLHRSKHHKMTFELSGVCADLVVFPSGSGETQSSLDVRVKDLEIYDHVPTSTWKKFATYLHEAGERESGTSMIHLEILTVKPIPELAASEIVLKATVLPLRLHVDQDALDFMSRFFEFRDASVEASSTPGDVPFLQRVEVNAVQVKLDFKPKRVDYAGLRSGRTTEFMNFFVLDGSDMVLRHVIIYGVSGFDRLGNTLNDIWMPDVKSNQLPGVLAGLAPIRSLVNVGGGVRQLFVVPMREYKKDGRIVRSIQKGAAAFAKTTSNELVRLGAKLAIGTQTVLQGAEDLLTSPNGPSTAFEEDRGDEEETKKISLYADQPIGVVQGLRGAFSGLERDLLLARDAIVAVPGEVVESGSARDAAKAVLRRAPTVILRPAIGVSKAVGQTLLGAGNTLDPSNRRRMEDKYKRH